MTAAELEQIHANISEAMAETMKLGAETAKIQAEMRYYPMVAFGTIVVAVIGLAGVVAAKLL